MSGQDGIKKAKQNTWTEERVELLKQLWLEGLSASQVAAKLGDGITRNAVIGKLHRLGLSGRGSPTRVSRPRTRRPRKPSAPRKVSARNSTNGAATPPPARANVSARATTRPEIIPEPILLQNIPHSERIGILDLTEKTCRWPLGDPGTEDFCFCAKTPQSGTPYCDYHASLAYQPANERRRPRKANAR